MFSIFRSSLYNAICMGVVLQGHVFSQANQTKSPEAPAATLRVTTRMVTVDVVAKDKHGRIIPDLTANDFQIFEQSPSNKKEREQKISAFLAISPDKIAAAAKESGSVRMPAGVYSNLVTTRLSVPPTILLLDGLNTEGDSGLQARRQMVKMLASIPPDTPVAVFVLGNDLQLLQSFTKDPQVLRSAAERVMKTNIDNGGLGVDPHDDPNSLSSQTQEMFGGDDEAPPSTVSSQPGRGAGSQGPTGPMGGELQMAEIRRFEKETFSADTDMRVRTTLDALRAIARHASGYPGRKNLIWISSSFPLTISPDAFDTHHLGFEGTRSYEDLVAVATNALADAKVSVYPVNPAGVQTQSFYQATKAPMQPGYGQQPYAEARNLDREGLARFSGIESMTQVAKQTGGEICVDNNDLSDCIKTAVNDGSSYYELAYYPGSNNWDGQFHRITVKSTKPGVQLSYREGYFARENAGTQVKDKSGDDPRLQEAACGDLLTATSLLLVGRALPPDSPKQAKYFVSVDAKMLSPATAEDGKREVNLQFAVCSFNRSGKPLQYLQDTANQKFTEQEYSSLRGFPHVIEFAPAEGTIRIRLAVRDLTNDRMGSIDVPYGAAVGQPATATTTTVPQKSSAKPN